METEDAQDESIRMFERSRTPTTPEPEPKSVAPEASDEVDMPQAIADILTGIASVVTFLGR